MFCKCGSGCTAVKIKKRNETGNFAVIFFTDWSTVPIIYLCIFAPTQLPMTSDFPYPLLSRDELVDSMNEFAQRGEAFYILIRFDACAGYFIPANQLNADQVKFSFHQPSAATHSELGDWHIEPFSYEAYLKKFSQVMFHIRRGDTFLINLTQPTQLHTTESIGEIYTKATATYKVWVKNHFVCFSPESFVRIENGLIRTFPMKGTIDAAVPDAERIILDDEKEKAEHATIVDLLRNDMSRVASGVKVERYRYIDRIRTHRGELLQVSSEISGQLPQGYAAKLGDILFSMLPAGSVTGAPKVRTLEILQEVEGYERGFYTGICGFFDGSVLDTAVMIRFIEETPDGLVFKSGGGITYRSDPEKEYNELIQKVYVPLH